ncbi:MAG TPA: helicase-related protein [Thermoanaerobaculia bacterium]|nr:helicase-related protein [Thermoanaerobaculia bacterium]
MSTDLTFLTNEPGKTLRSRFEKLLAADTRLFDCLVGYFFISGFHQLYPVLGSTEKIRILIGLKTDRTSYDLLQKAKGEQLGLSYAETKEQVPATILEELDRAEDTLDVENGVRRFVEWVRSGKLEVRVYPSDKIHAKVYIMTFNEGDRDAGRVITGSSNFSQAGLQDNLEFNVELKMRADYDYALAKFNELWGSAVDVTEEYVDTIERKSPYAEFTPYELYLKLLYEYFKGELNRPEELTDTYLPAMFRKLRYQEDAVLSAKRILEEYGGVFLSDVVGLGKTYMSALLARELDGRTLVIAPPPLLDRNNPGSWPNVLSEFRVSADFESLGKLDALLERGVTRYANVFIDESHRFRTETNTTYEKLAKVCRGKRVILVSATPLNNTPADILSQIKLFQNAKNSTIPNLQNLEYFFRDLQKRLKGLDRQHDRELYFATIKENAKKIRESVLKYLMIRRTRTEIVKYYGDDLDAQGFRFAEVVAPEALFYQLDQRENALFHQTSEHIVREFSFARYNPLDANYYTGDCDALERQSGANLARFMRVLLIKRLESSFHAFRLTLGRFIHSHETFISEFRKGYAYISKKHLRKVFSALEEGDEETVQRLVDESKVERLPAADFKPKFLTDLVRDLAILQELRQLWGEVENDPKWEAFRVTLLSHPKLISEKLIIFTESQETAEYLARRVGEEVDSRVTAFSGQSSEEDRRRVIANFDFRAYRPQDDYRILVTTDVLSEGVNLHRSSVVINYDLPWNPTRLMQRVGRINRVDTPFETIYTFNFFPSEKGNDLIKLRESAEAKIQAFIEMLGADARLLTEGEEVKSHDLFAQMNSRATITGEDTEEESELEYLTEIRRVRDEDPALFERIKRLPRKARSTKVLVPEVMELLPPCPALLTYFRKGRLDKFFVAHDSRTAGEIDFMTAVKILRADPSERRGAIVPAFYALLDRNRVAFDQATMDESDAEPVGVSRTNDAYILRRLKAKDIRHFLGFTDEDEEFLLDVIRLLENGALPRPTTKKVAAELRQEASSLGVLRILRRGIGREFFQATRAEISHYIRAPREVILSSFIR